ncbi:MAG: FtsW/RodA/SpoVE family cell cycle protein [Clostridiaceae bacterium]|nr:FtsW/RodA/SpoVE family cell cycle protein [Clostridiaceae bacterium]
MSFADLAHLARHGFVLLVLPVAVILLIKSLRDFFQGMKYAKTPVSGFFLLASDPLDDELVRPLPLFHTTLIGASRSADIRVKGKGVMKRNAIIYFFNRRWYLEPASRALLFLNHKEIKERTEIKQGDIIGIGGQQFSFVVDIGAIEKRGPDEELFAEPKGRSWISGILIVLLQIAGTVMIYLGMQGTVTEGLSVLVAIVLGVLFLFAQLLYLSMSRLTPGFDESIWHSLMLLSTLGLILQTRLLFLSRSFPDWIEGYTMEQWYASLKSVFFSQTIAIFIGLLLFPLILFLVRRTSIMEKLAPICFVLTPLLYLTTLLMGQGSETHGAGLWISLPGGFSLQLTEFAKISWIIVLADFFKTRASKRSIIVFAVWAGVNAVLVLLLPDLGSLMVLLPTTLIVFAIMTSEYLISFLALAGASVLGVLAYNALPYVQRRLYGWISLWEDLNDYNRQIVYGLQAVGRGGLLGRGLGNGSPDGIPLASSDMVFTILWEEMGLLIAISVIVLFFVIWLRSASAIITARDGFTSSLILALSSCLLMEALIVIGGTTGLIPLTGVTLPFIARGGSSIMAKWIMAALLIGMIARSRRLSLSRRAQRQYKEELEAQS